MLGDQFRHLLEENRLKISLTELSKVTKVSTSQARYWDRKGYIHSLQGKQGKKHYFTISAVLQTLTIKHFLDQGYTLKMAVNKEHNHQKGGKVFRHFITDRVMDIPQAGLDKGVVSLGPLDDDPTKEVYAQVTKNGQTSLHVKTKSKRRKNSLKKHPTLIK